MAQRELCSIAPAETCNIDGCKVVCESGQQPGCAPSALLQGIESGYKVPHFCLVVEASRHKTRPVGVDVYRGDVGACTAKNSNLAIMDHSSAFASRRHTYLVSMVHVVRMTVKGQLCAITLAYSDHM